MAFPLHSHRKRKVPSPGPPSVLRRFSPTIIAVHVGKKKKRWNGRERRNRRPCFTFCEREGGKRKRSPGRFSHIAPSWVRRKKRGWEGRAPLSSKLISLSKKKKKGKGEGIFPLCSIPRPPAQNVKRKKRKRKERKHRRSSVRGKNRRSFSRNAEGKKRKKQTADVTGGGRRSAALVSPFHLVLREKNRRPETEEARAGRHLLLIRRECKGKGKKKRVVQPPERRPGDPRELLPPFVTKEKRRGERKRKKKKRKGELLLPPWAGPSNVSGGVHFHEI